MTRKRNLNWMDQWFLSMLRNIPPSIIGLRTSSTGQIDQWYISDISKPYLNMAKNDDLIARMREAGLVGESTAMIEVYNLIGRVAAMPISVLIQGESGTGKEVVAKAIHGYSPRKNNKFVAFDAGSIVSTLAESELFGHERGSFTGADKKREGLFMVADKGTIFIDEVGNMSPDLQVKLLRALQEGEIYRVGSSSPLYVDVRVIAATNSHLQQAVREGAFRQDLFYRINVVGINLPPLRERGEDILLLTRYFIEQNRSGLTIEEEAMALLQAYHWPGNVRELQNFLNRASVLADNKTITADYIREDSNLKSPAHFTTIATPYGTPLELARRELLDQFDRSYISAALGHNKGDITAAAAEIKADKKALETRIKELGLQK